MDDERNKNETWLQEQFNKEDGFHLPDGYFDALEDRVFGKIEAAGLQRHTPLKLVKKPAQRFSLPRIFMAAAAIFSLVLGAIWFFQPVASTDAIAPIATVELSEEEIENYVLDNVQDFEAEQLAMLPSSEDSDGPAHLPPSPATTHDSLEDLSPEDVEHILNDMTEDELEEIL